MSHENLHRRQEVSSSSNRTFGLVFTVVFFLVGLLPLLYNHAPHIWSLVVSWVFFLLALAWPASLGLLNHWWTRFGLLLHSIISPITLGILFFGVIMPIGIVMRLMSHDPLRLKFDSNAKSYWIERPATAESEFSSMNNQF